MVGGQVADLEAEDKQLPLKELELIHYRKTGALLRASILTGAVLGGANAIQLENFRTFARHIGIAFQIQDDILDVVGEQEKIGKPVGSDQANHKSTYPSLLTLDGAREQLAFHIKQSNEILSTSGFSSGVLTEIVTMIANRDR
jgi:geranylgeranyl diphosphate synthase type II